jgi:PKD repeat protein
MVAVVTAALVLAPACGDGGGTPPPDNERPEANFTEVCTNLSCVFTDASTDPDGNATITSRSWVFGDSPTPNTETNPTHVYAAAGIYTVVLTVTDDEGETDDFSKVITVTAAPPGNTPPTAAFTFDANACRTGTCAFTSTSTDADGTIASYAWNFGEPASGAANTSTEQNPTHTYAPVTQSTQFTVTLTVTDDDGAASAAATQTVTIEPPPQQLCVVSGKTVDCSLDLTQSASLTFTVISRDCELGANQLHVTQPLPAKTVFFNGCSAPVNQPIVIMGEGGQPRIYPAGAVQVRFTQGNADPGDPVPGFPAIRLEGSFPNWTLNIDDGGNPTAQGEPDFDDIVVRVQATP